MAQKSFLLLDDAGNTTEKGRRRSRLLRKLAGDYAEHWDADIEYLYVEEMNFRANSQKKIRQLAEKRKEHELQLAEELSTLPVHVHIDLVSGAPLEVILERMGSSPRPEMIVMGTQGLRGLKKLFLGSVSEEVLRNAEVPVMVLGPEAQESEFKTNFKKKMPILVLTDLKVSSRRAEKTALQLAKKLGVKVLLFHSVGDQIRRMQENVYMTGYVPFSFDKVIEEMKADAKKSMEKRKAEFERQGVSVIADLILESEYLEDSLKKEARKGFQLIVMGTHSRNKVVKAFLGSTARKAILSSPVPVVVVRS